MSERQIAPIMYIERKPDSEKYRIVGKGITVDFLAHFLKFPEWTAERICKEYNLTPAEVHAAWSFYYDHKEEIDERTARDEERHRILAKETDIRRQEILRRYEETHGKKWEPPTDLSDK